MPLEYPVFPTAWKSLVNANGSVDFAEMTKEGRIFVDITYKGKVYNRLVLQCTNEAHDPTRLDVLIKDPENENQFLRIWFKEYMLRQALTRSIKKSVQ